MGQLSPGVSRWLDTRVWTKGPAIADVVSVLAIWFAIALLYFPALGAGEFWWTDEARHAMDGVFFLDLGRDLPWRAPYDYALQYFAKYPAIALNWYPPFFAAVESFFFAAFGISEATARFSVMAFGLAGAVGWYAWTKPIWGRLAAVLSFLLFFSLPGPLHWTRSVMLEVPAVAMIVLSILGFERYLTRPNYSRAGIAGLLLACTLLLKQSTVFIVPALMAYALLSRRGRLLWRREAVVAYVIVGTALAVLVVHAVKFGVVGLGATLGDLHVSAHGAAPRWSLSRVTLYFRALWDVGGAPFALLCLFGAAQVAVVRTRPQDWLILSWLVAWYVIATVMFGVPGNAARYTMYAFPPLALLACLPLSPSICHYRAIRGVTLVLIVALVASNVWKAWTEEHRFVTGYREAARIVLAQPDPGLILFAGKHDGNFIFNTRALDPDGKVAVLRADKVLVSMAVHKYFGTVSYVENQQDILDLFDRFGIGLVVIESRDIVGLKEFKLLADLVRGEKFALLADVPVETNVQESSNLSVRVFRYLDRKPDRGGRVGIPLPHMGMDIELPLPARQ